MNVIRGMTPPCGWTLPVSPDVTIRAATHDQLVSRVFEWRIQNGVAPGDISAEIDRYICGLHPAVCRLEPVDSQLPPGVTADDRLANRVLFWVAGMIRPERVPQGGWALAPLKEANAREDACVRCHRNKGWESTCGGCDMSVKAASARVRSNRANFNPHGIQACELFGWDNASACHLTEAALAVAADDVRRGMAPDWCWMKNAPPPTAPAPPPP